MKKNKLTKALKQEWLKALKSGKYVQGINSLKIEAKDDDPEKHCCLGVLCEVHPDMSISAIGGGSDYPIMNGVNNLGQGSKYDMFDQFIPFNLNITEINDQDCDGKYTSVIPLIEALETID